MAVTQDPSTAVYQSVMAALQGYSQLGGGPGVGVIQTWLDPSAANFQLLVEKYGSGDTPALLLLPIRDTATPWGSASQEFAWEMDLQVNITTDWESISPINTALWLVRMALVSASQADAAFGSPYIVKGGWKVTDGRLSPINVPGMQDRAAAGSGKFKCAAVISLKCVIGWSQAVTMAQTWSLS